MKDFQMLYLGGECHLPSGLETSQISPSKYVKEKEKQAERRERTEGPIYTSKGFNRRNVREPRCGTNTLGRGIMRMSPPSPNLGNT